MLDPRWAKVLADLWNNKTRTFLTILTIAVGVFAVGFISSTAIIIMDDMQADYQSANAHGAQIYCEPFNDDLLPAARQTPGVQDVEGRSGLSARILRGAEKIAIELAAIPPLDDMRIDRLRPQAAGEPLKLADQELFLERSAMSALPVKAGDILTLELADGRTRDLRVAAWVHDVSGIPYVFWGRVVAYVTPETMQWLGGSRDYTQMLVTVTENPTDQAHVTAVAQAVADKIKKSGREVYQVFVYQPGRHFAHDITQGVMFILSVLGAIVLFLSAFLVINTITALLGQHVRQIGIMKAIGGLAFQIAGMYLALVMSFGAVSLMLAVPLGAVAAFATAQGLSQFLNFDLGPFRIPARTVLLQVGVALLVPLLAALVPVLNSVRVTVREAISTYGLGKGHFGRGWLDRALERVRFLSRPSLISLRNTFRRKFRLGLTLSTLTLGGAIFIAVFNLWTAFDILMVEVQGYVLSDVNISLERAYRLQRIETTLMDIPGVVGVEGWGVSSAQFLSKDKSSAVEVVFFAPPADSTLIKPVITSGRWLAPGDENAIVVGNHLLKERPDLKVGDEVLVKVEDKEYTWHIVGIYKLVGNVAPPLVYTNYDYLARICNETGAVYELRVVTSPQDGATQKRIAKISEARLKEVGVRVSQITTGVEWRAQQGATIDVLVYFLLVMALLIALVGGLGLMGTMSMNVMERSREIGVMRAIGASNPAIFQLVIVEGVLIGLISWVLAVLLSVPITWVLNAGVGTAVMTIPMDFTFGWNGVTIWLGGVLGLSALASALPAWNAMQLTVREVLAYE